MDMLFWCFLRFCLFSTFVRNVVNCSCLQTLTLEPNPQYNGKTATEGIKSTKTVNNQGECTSFCVSKGEKASIIYDPGTGKCSCSNLPLSMLTLSPQPGAVAFGEDGQSSGPGELFLIKDLRKSYSEGCFANASGWTRIQSDLCAMTFGSQWFQIYAKGGTLFWTAVYGCCVDRQHTGSIFSLFLVRIPLREKRFFNSYPSTEMIGPANYYPRYGNDDRTWCPGSRTSDQWVEFAISESIYITEVHIYETFYAGGVETLSIRDPNSNWMVLWQTPGLEILTYSRIFSPSFIPPDFKSNALRIDLDLGATNVWSEFDAVRVIGTRTRNRII